MITPELPVARSMRDCELVKGPVRQRGSVGVACKQNSMEEASLTQALNPKP